LLFRIEYSSDFCFLFQFRSLFVTMFFWERIAFFYEVLLFKKTASPQFLIQGFSVGLRANAEAGTWEALKALGP